MTSLACTYFTAIARVCACAVLHLCILRALIEHSKVTKSVSGKGRQPSCGDCAESPPPSLPVSVPVKTVPNLLPPTLPMDTAPNILPQPFQKQLFVFCVSNACAYQWHACPTWAEVGESRGICCQNLSQGVGSYLVGIVPIHSNHILFPCNRRECVCNCVKCLRKVL